MWLAAPAALRLTGRLWRLPTDEEAGEITLLLPLLGLNVMLLLASLALLNLGLWLAA
jgi:1,4-dihydroxy-2-naphthoate octaprenyltransferase